MLTFLLGNRGLPWRSSFLHRHFYGFIVRRAFEQEEGITAMPTAIILQSDESSQFFNHIRAVGSLNVNGSMATSALALSLNFGRCPD